MVSQREVLESTTMSKKTRNGMRAGISGVVGAVVAFGITELVHGLYTSVPSILVSLAQRIVELTAGTLVTQGIELLGTADIPTLIASVLIGTVVFAALLGNLAVRRPSLALLGVAVLAAIAIAAALADPFVEAFPTVVTIVVALLAGSAVTEGLRRAGQRGLARGEVPRSGLRGGGLCRAWCLPLARRWRRRSRSGRGRRRASA